MRNVARVIAAGTTSLLIVGLAPATAAHAASVASRTPAKDSTINAMPDDTVNHRDVVVKYDGPTLSRTIEVTPPSGTTGFTCSPTLPTAPSDTIACDLAITGGTFPDGVYTVHTTGTVTLPGVPGPVDDTYSFTLDTIVPTVTGLTIADNPYNNASKAGNEPIVVSGVTEKAATVTVKLESTGGNNPAPQVVNADPVSGAFSASFSSAINDGALTATATPADKVNTGTDYTALGFKDTVTPTILTPAAGVVTVQKSSTGGVPNGIVIVASETLNQASTTIALSKDGNTVASTKSFPSDSSVKATPTDVLPEGTYTATTTLVDSHGNASSSLTRTFVIDDTAPNAPSYSPGPAVINKAREAAYSVSGTGEPGATVTLTLTDTAATVVTGVTTVTNGGAWTITFNDPDLNASDLVDGVVALSATQKDLADNVSSAAVASTLKDTVAPRVSGVAFDKTDYKAGSPITAVVTGTVDNGTTTAGEAGDSVLVTIKDAASGAVSGVGVTDGSGHFSVSLNIASLADGTVTAEAVATDAAGNASTKGTATAVKDTAAPAVPTVTMTNPINAGNASAVTVSGTAEPSSQVLISINDNDAGTAPVQTSGTTNGAGSYGVGSINVSSLTDGTLTATVVSVDTAGNTSAAGTGTATKDVVGPAAPTLTVPSFVNNATKAAVPVSGTAEPGSTVTLTIHDSGAGSVTKNATASPSTGAWSTTVDLTSLADGVVSVQAVATDAAGNPGAGTSKNLTKDTVAPGTPSSSVTPTAFTYAHRADDLVVSGTVAPADNGVGGLIADITVSDGPGTADLVASVPVSANAFTHTFTNAQVLFFPDGQLSVRVSIRDAAGNTSVSDVTPLLKDVTQLAIASSAPAAGGAVKTASAVVVTFNEAVVTGTDPAAPPYSKVTVKKGGVTLAGSLVFSNGNKTLTFTPGAPLSEGVYDVFVHATDANDTGDVLDTGATPTFSFTVDATAPAAPTVTTITNPVNSINKGAVAVSGNAVEEGLTVTVTITGTSGSVSKSATSGAGGAYTVSGIDVSSLPDGTITATAKSADAAGNESPVSGTKTATKETVLPTVSGLAATATHYGALTSTVTGTLSEAGTVALSATDGTHTATGTGTVAPDKTFSGTLNLASFSTGSVTVTAIATDTVGNVGPAATTTTTHDAATPPSAPAKPVATAGDRKAAVAFTTPAGNGAPITSYTVVASPGGKTATGTSSPIFVTGLTNGQDYTFTVKATNRAGTGPASPASDAVMPLGVSTITLNALPSKITYGTYITTAGVVHRSDSSAPFEEVGVFARTDSGAVKLLAVVPVSSTGAWSYRLRPSANLTYFAVYGGDEVNDESPLSARRRVLVAVRVSASAPSGSHTVNQVVTGTVAPNKAGKVVYLYKITSTGSLVRIATGTLTSSSTYRFSVRLPAGKTKLRVIVPTTPNNVSGSISFTATRT
jgi:methionine-rich copper-binding protein CopC